MPTADSPTRRIKTADTVFGIIETVQELQGAKPAEIASHLDLAQSTVHDHLATLESMRYVVADGAEYRLSLKFLDHGIHSINQFAVLDAAKPLVRELAAETGETAFLHVEEHEHIVAIFREEGDHGVKIDWRGKYFPMHCTAAGKAILANYPESRVRDILDRQGLAEITANTTTNREELLSELSEVAADGFARNDGGSIKNVRGISSAVVVNDDVLGAVSVGGYRYRITDERFHDEIPTQVMGVANEIEFLMTEHDHTDLIA